MRRLFGRGTISVPLSLDGGLLGCLEPLPSAFCRCVLPGVDAQQGPRGSGGDAGWGVGEAGAGQDRGCPVGGHLLVTEAPGPQRALLLLR